MSGIVGVWSFTEQGMESTLIEHMLERLVHRGPDGQSTWCQEGVALGSRLLWTTPESVHEQLPLQRSDLAITADARLDNRSELLATLHPTAPSQPFTDSELILLAYRRWGTACLKELLGDFAFAIWDTAKERLFCARDPMGVKLLYYYHSRDLFAFASEINPLLHLPGVTRKLNDEVIANYLLPGLDLVRDVEETFFESVFCLSAGQCLVVSPRHVQKERYWAFDHEFELRLDSDQAYEEAFAALFTDAVKCRLRSAFPIGSALSGGLDSSSVTCTARALLSASQPLHTYYLLSPVPDCDERPYVNAVLASGEFSHREIPMPSPLSGMADLLRGRDSPSSLHNHPLMLDQYRAARQDGIRVFLDGIDGDSVIGYGRGYLAELVFQRQWHLFAAHIRGQLKGSMPSRKAGTDKYAVPVLSHLLCSGHWRQFAEGINTLSSELHLSRTQLGWRAARSLVAQQAGRWNPSRVERWRQKQAPFIDTAFARQIGLHRYVEAMLNQDNVPRGERHEHYQMLTSGRLQRTFSDCDQVAATTGLEVRHPLSDRRIAEFCLALPGDQKFRQGWIRSILRRSIKGILPEEIRWRPGKTDFGPHIIHSFQTTDKPLLEELLLNSCANSTPYLDSDALRGIYWRFQAKPTNADAHILLRTAKLLLWLQQNP